MIHARDNENTWKTRIKMSEKLSKVFSTWSAPARSLLLRS